MGNTVGFPLRPYHRYRSQHHCLQLPLHDGDDDVRGPSEASPLGPPWFYCAQMDVHGGNMSTGRASHRGCPRVCFSFWPGGVPEAVLGGPRGPGPPERSCCVRCTPVRSRPGFSLGSPQRVFLVSVSGGSGGPFSEIRGGPSSQERSSRVRCTPVRTPAMLFDLEVLGGRSEYGEDAEDVADSGYD